ncbi:short chain dehydrogenase [Phytophthora infestans]|uniref:Short chain dehydrogenase n=1 Tax=Phytophthora infestans TaxID=4787 RepID=A0A8S9TNL0_PHYIN|nr:short chain dehydrogenase [Phytophthora infestans]
MVRKKRKGVIKETQADGAVAPNGVDLRLVLADVPVNAELPAVLGGGDLTAWYEALCSAKYSLYEQLKKLQLFRSKCKLLLSDAESDYSNIRTSIWRLVFRLSVAPPMYPLRKNLGLILDVLAMSEASESSKLRVVAAEELRAFLDSLRTESDTQNQTPEQRVALLDRMLHLVEFPYLARILVENPVTGGENGDAEHLLQFVTCCADQLEAVGAPIVEYHEANQESEEIEEDTEAAASTNVVLAASERCGHALKSVIVLATMKEILDSRLQQCRGTNLDKLTEAFLRIVRHCVLLLQTNVVHKDLLTQAGLAYCLVLRMLLQLTISSNATKLLLQTAYPELSIIRSDACTNPQLRAHIEKDVETFGDLSRLAVCRGLLNSLANQDLALPATNLGLDDDSKTEQSVLDAIFTGVQQFCDQESYNTRLFAFQVLEAFLRRAVTILQQQKEDRDSSDKYPAVLAVETLTNLTTAVLLNWEHPSKKVNQFMATIFARIVHYFVLSEGFQDWSDAILSRLVELPPTSRAKYGSLTLLVAEAGAKPVLQASPALLSSLLSAVGQKDYAAPAAANLFAQILDDLSGGNKSKKTTDDESVAAWRELWLPDVVKVLLSSDANLRSRVAMYVIPLLLKKDSDCVPVLIKRLQVEATKEQDGDAADVALWAELEVLKFARKKMAPEKLVGVSMHEIERGLRHAKTETRGTAFDALCASLKSTSMPSDDELRLVKCYLVVNGKEIGPAGRMNTLIGLKTVLIRIKETMRLAGKKSVSSEHAGRDELAAAVSFKHWVELFVVSSVYPGALPQRLTLGLEVLLLYVQLFGLESESPSLLRTGQMVTTLLNMLISAWDSIRSLAFTVLDLYPDELPGYSTPEELRTLVDWAVGLCGSPRQRESDAGAMFIRLLFQKCSAAMQRYGLTLQQSERTATEASSTNPDVAFVLQLTQVILSRIEALSPAEIRRGESPLVHGFLLSLHYVLDNIDFDTLSSSDAAHWPAAMTQIFAAIHQSMRASLAVVGDATSGAGDKELSASFAGVVGEVSAVAKTSSSALRVDCRGHLIVENGDGLEEEDGNAEQRAVVGSWLAARECGAILELLMRRVPLPSSNSTSDSVTFFTAEMAQRGGETLLNSLFELKHKGAVATAYQAFEGVCRAFLAHGEQSLVLGGLPARWADRLLERLERSEQHFILRRSSGFAFSFVAILRAEPRNSAAVILPKVMSTLLRLAGEDTDAAERRDTHQEHHSLWRARVHALNILKLICQDGVLAEDVARYVVDMFELAVRGFDCGSWAVRNSSMMLFAAATQRAIGDKRIADGGTHRQVASDDVFSRFQQLRGFLARELTKLLTADKKSSALGGAAPPGLYPLLLFLSRLRPGDEDDQRVADAPASPCDGSGLASFVPLVIKCASQPTMAIRHMAAKVVASIVSDADAAYVLSMLCTELPQGVRSAKDQSATSPMSHNYVHGILAQIRHLATKYLAVGGGGKRATPVSKDAQVAFLEVVVAKLLPSTMWLWTGQKETINPAIRAEIVATVDVVLRFYAEDASKVAAVLNDASKDAFVQTTQQIQAEVERQLMQRCDSDRDAAVLVSTRPGMYVLDRSLVAIWFSLWTGRQLDALVKKMLVSNVLQIRKKAAKQFANKLVIDGFSSEAVAELQTVLITQFLTETHPKVRARQLQLLVRCVLHQAIADTQTQRAQLQTKLTQMLGISADTRVLAPVLELLALMASHQNSEKDALYLTLSKEIELRSDENQPLILRQAAASVLHRSGLLLLHTKQDTGAELPLTGWMSALRLLQDDDVRVRAGARHAVQSALLETTDTTTASLSDATVLPLAVEYMTVCFARTEHGAACLAKVLFELVDAPSVLTAYAGAAGVKAQDWDDLYRRIFESESSNYFAEQDVLAQNLVHALLARTVEDGEAMRHLRDQVLTAVVSALLTLNQEAQRSGQWLGGITYYTDVFAPLFGLLAAGVAILTSCQDTAELQSLANQVQQLAQEACGIHSNDEVTHPLMLRALELLANKDLKNSMQTDSEPGYVDEVVPGCGRVVYFSVGVHDSNALATAITDTVQQFGGPVNALINNAGLALGAPACFQDQSIGDISMMVGTNASGVLFAAHAALNQGGMFAQKRGVIVNVTSVTALEAPPFSGEAVYYMAKATQEGFSNSLRNELCGTNIKVVVVRSGVVVTNFHEQRVGFDKNMYSQFIEGCEPLVSEDIADAISWVLEKPECVMVKAIDVVPTAQRSLSLFDREWSARNAK